MKVFILITDSTVVGVYSDLDKLVSEFTTIYSETKIDEVEIWDTNGEFITRAKIVD